MEREIFLLSIEIASLSKSGCNFHGLTYTGTIRLLYLEGDSHTKKRNPYNICTQVHILLALPVCPAHLLIEM